MLNRQILYLFFSLYPRIVHESVELLLVGLVLIGNLHACYWAFGYIACYVQLDPPPPDTPFLRHPFSLMNALMPVKSTTMSTGLSLSYFTPRGISSSFRLLLGVCGYPPPFSRQASSQTLRPAVQVDRRNPLRRVLRGSEYRDSCMSCSPLLFIYPTCSS